MADISDLLEVIQKEAPGESVRDAIIQLLRVIHNVGGNVVQLDGHPSTDFVSFDEVMSTYDFIADRLQFVDMPKPPEDADSKKVMSSGVIYDAVNATTSILESLNHYAIPIGDLKKNLEAIESAKSAIWNAIVTQSGGKVRKSKRYDFYGYAEIIRGLTVGSGVNAQKYPDTIKANGTYTSPEPEPNETPIAYNEVDVDVPFKTKTANSRGCDKLTAPEGFIGFNKISVNVSGSSMGHGRTSGRYGSSVDENGIADVLDITENGVDIVAESEGVMGWRSVNVEVTDMEINADAVYKVNFFDDDQVTKIGDTVLVPYGQNCAGPEVPDRGTEHHVGWDPSPTHVRKDMDCYAVYSSAPVSVSEISDSWETIIANRGMNYALGSYKSLALENGWGTIRMQKVYSNEDTSTSTWLAMDSMSRTYRFDGNERGQSGPYSKGRSGWSYSGIRRWLNSEFLTTILPEVLRNEIVDVEKYTYEYDLTTASKFMTKVRDYLWIPSITEIIGADTSEFKLQVAELQYQDARITAAGGFFEFSNLKPYDEVMGEFKGHHYSAIYPDSELQGGIQNLRPSGEVTSRNFSRQPTDPTKLIKYKCGNTSSPVAWYTRTGACIGNGYNSNWHGVMNFSVNSVGYVNFAVNHEYGSNTEIILGFCL